MIDSATAIHDASNDGAIRHPPSSPLVLASRRPPAPDPLDDALVPPLDDASPPPSAGSPDDVDPDEEDGVPDEDVVPASGVGFVPPVTVMVRVVFATPSLLFPDPLADIAATHSVIVPFVAGAVNENW